MNVKKHARSAETAFVKIGGWAYHFGMHETSDNELISAYLNGTEEVLEMLIGRYLKPIYSFTYRYANDAASAEDLTQETFLRAWRNLKKFNPDKSFKTWLFAIAKNASLDFLKKSRSASGGKKTLPFSTFDDEEGNNAIADTAVDPSPLPDALFERKDLAHELMSAMEKLSPLYRMPLFLRYNDHFTFAEIAKSLGEPMNTIQSRHRRALFQLKKLLTR